jgi:hypothetical protein
MTEPASPKYPFPGDIDRSKLHTEQQLDPMINREMLLPNPLDPIGHIETEGQAFRNLSSGRMPLWVLMLGWATIGVMAFGLIGLFLHALTDSLQTAIATQKYDPLWLAIVSLLPGLLIPGLLLMVLFRATWRSR